MKKISLIFTFVVLCVALFALTTFAASFTRGPEGDTITPEDLACDIELLAGSTHTAGYINLNGALDGNYSTWWGGPTGSKIKITFANEWEITSAKVILSANWCGCKVSFYAADDTLLGSQSFGGYSANTGLCWGGDATNADRQDLAGAVGKITYGDEDKAVKYVIFENTGDKWGYLPMAAEFILVGRERIPSVGCDSHEFAPVYTVNPGCTTTGTVVNTCTKCGAEEAPATVPALGHNMGDYTIKVPATCNTSAVLEYACTRCGEVIERPTHIQDVTDYADIYTAAASGAGGYTTSHQALYDNNMDSYLHASGGWFVESWIELDMPYYITSVTVWTGSWGDNNSWEAFFTFYYQAPGSDEWITVSPTKAAGVIKAGEKYKHTLELAEPVYADAIKIKVDRLASFQGQAFEAEVAGTLFPENAPLGHTWEITEVVPAACDAGYTLSTCTVCGETKTDAYTKALGHNYTYKCDKVCMVCGEETNPDATHTMVHVDAKAATCTENGNVEYWYCSDCGYAWLDEACTLVTNQMSVVVPTTEHEWDDGWFMGWPYPTCQNPTGTKTYTCIVCNETKDVEETVDLNDVQWHNAQLDWETEVIANCQTAGYAKYTCADCGEVFEIVTPADTENGHEWVTDESVSYDATCAEDGYSKQNCSICGATRELTLDKELFGNHQYGYDPETYVEATCQNDGYAFYTCEVCGDSYEETTSAGPWLHEMVNSSNGLLQTCAVCGESSFGNAELNGVDNDLSAMFVWDGTALNIWNSEFDVYYSFTVVSSENGVYVLTLSADDDVIGFNGATAVLTLVSDGGTLVITANDGTVYTLENKAPDFDYLLNGTYAYYDSITGELKVVFKFENGVITVLVDNLGMGFPETFEYDYDYMSGQISTPEVPSANFSIIEDIMYFGPGFVLVPYEDVPVDPEDPADYGDKIGSITVVTTDTYGYFDLYSYTANAAGQYAFYAPAGLGFYSKALYDVYGDAEVGFYDNETGAYAVFTLAAGETIEFYVGAMTKDTWTIDVYFVASEHTHTEVEIPMVRPTPTVTGYTAGIMCSECGETIKAPVEITVTEMEDPKDPNFRVASANLFARENISLRYSSVVTEGYNNAYMVFVFNGKEYVVTEYKIDSDNGRYVFVFDKTFPQFMSENIEAYVYAETAEGQYSVNSVLEYSVMKYVTNQLKKNDAALTTAMSDLLYMGAMTQVYLNYKTDALVTNLVKDQGYTLTPNSFDKIDSSVFVQAVTGDKDSGYVWKSGTLEFGASTEMTVKFEAKDIEGLKVKVNIAGVDTYFDASELEIDQSNGRYIVNINYIKSYEFNEVATFTFEKDGKQIGTTLTYSINSFLYRNYENTNYSESARELMKALYVYGESMAAYFN